MSNPLLQLKEHGQSIWIDYIRRDLIHNGGMQAFIDQDGIRGVTSNPAIFEQAIAQSNLYDEAMKSINESDTVRIYEILALQDIQAACDVFLPVYEKSNGGDGFVSLEVSPRLANDTQGTIEEAKRLFAEVNRLNVMIKVPATAAGIPAIEALIADGLNINVTLIFSQSAYEQVCEAYIRGLEKRVEAGQTISKIASVASVFISRIDAKVDKILEEKDLNDLLGKVGIANLKLVYQQFKSIFHGPRFEKLKQAGASVQRPLWASTSTKNPNYRDVIYVETLIGPDTVNTLPLSTLEAFRDHGVAATTVENHIDEAKQIMDQLDEAGINLDQIMDQLLEEGVEKFVTPFDQLLNSIEEKRGVLR